MDIIGLCLPLVQLAASIAQEAYKAAEDARYTKKTCLLLSDRLEAGSRGLSDLYRHREEREKEDKFKSSNFYNNLQSYVNAATEIKRFIEEVSQSGGAMKYIKSHSHKEKINQLIKRYDEAINDLKLGIDIDQFEKIQALQDVMENEFDKMNMALETMQAGMATQGKDLKLLIDMVSSMTTGVNSQSHEIKPIPSGDIRDPDQGEKRGKVVKKIYKGYVEVACKPFTDDDFKAEHFQIRLAILGKLISSNNIIKFLGISNIDGYNMMVFEWAENGDLKTFYENYEITWIQKLKIVHDVCAGLAFLHECTIYHHDVRCENILITDSIDTAKIANFTLSREYQHKSAPLKAINELIPWMAPEKLKDPDNFRYNIKCEIFSFGMFVWELSFQQVPYLKKFDNDCVKVSHHIKEGKREDLTGFNPLNEIQKCFKNIVAKAWNQEPTLRPNMPTFVNQLSTLYKSQRLPRSPFITPINRDSSISSGHSELSSGHSELRKEILHEMSDDELSLDELSLDDAPQVTMTLEDGIKLHKDKSETARKLAWECFKYHADSLKDPRAIYWKGYYLLEGYGGVTKNQQEASKCFKEAADKDISDAQVRYAFSIISKVNDPLMAAEFLKYLEKAAFHENQAALYNLGNIHYEGKLSLPKNKEQAIIYYKKAALKGHDKSIARLDALKISVYDD